MYNKAEFSVKKAIVLSFLLLASTMILAHAIVPHHHSDVDNCNHSHCHGNIKNCSLATVYIKFNNDKQICQTLDSNFDSFPCFLALFPNYSTSSSLAIDLGLPDKQKPYLSSYYTEYISQSSGLRAPPFSIKN